MTLVHRAPVDIENARLSGLRPLEFGSGLVEGAGTLESAELTAAIPFDDLVGSFNAELKKGESVELWAQVRVAGKWSKFYGLGRWDDSGGRSMGAQADETAKVDVDTLKISGLADAFRYKVVLAGKNPKLRQVAVAYADSKKHAAGEPDPFTPGPWVAELEVAPRSQLEEQEKFRHDICSPTSLSMVLHFWSKSEATKKVALSVQDRATQLFGNWTLNAAYAGHRGLSAYVARLSGLSQLQDEIAKGRPVVVSATFAEGELTGAPLKKTKGHLFVVAGFTSEGDVIVMDPAGKAKNEVRRVYKRAEFDNVWRKKKLGLAYVAGPQFPQTFRVAKPVADLRRKPGTPAEKRLDDPDLGTQALYGEEVLVTAAKAGWAKAEAMGQARAEGKKWRPYPGWMDGRSLTMFHPGLAPQTLVRAKKTALDGSELSMGSRLWFIEGQPSAPSATVLLLDGRAARIEPAALAAESGDLRGRIVENARRFLGEPYVWGGRSAWGVDCSGLVQLSYLIEGIEVPRDAHDQYLKARPVPASELKPGDALFLTKTAAGKDVTHVMMYLGGDAFIESRMSAAKTLTGSIKARFGRELSELHSGAVVADAADDGRSRTLHLGSFLEP